jgi:AraC-like DNA-binding protein
MTYRELPAPGLECLWIRRAGEEPAVTPVLPDACSDLIWQSGRGAFVAGPDTGPAPVRTTPGAVYAGARFGPAAGGAALGLPLSELRDRRVELTELRPDLAARLPGDLDPRDAAREVAAIAAELIAAAPPDRAVEAAARRLSEPGSRVEALAGELGLSERQLRRRCAAAAGYGPKTLQRVLRFRRFLALGDAGELARRALEAGYADQPHLTRECVRLSGRTPRALVG